jgi:hypothetical protein
LFPWASHSISVFNLCAAGGSTIFTRVALLYASTLVAANFGKGLKNKVHDVKWASITNAATPLIATENIVVTSTL